jgi:hypothetical protein
LRRDARMPPLRLRAAAAHQNRPSASPRPSKRISAYTLAHRFCRFESAGKRSSSPQPGWERPRDFQGDNANESMLGQHMATIHFDAEFRGGQGNRGASDMAVYALILVVLGSGNVGNTQPFRVAHYHSLESCQAAAHEAATTGLDNRSLGFVCVRVYGDTKRAGLN